MMDDVNQYTLSDLIKDTNKLILEDDEVVESNIEVLSILDASVSKAYLSTLKYPEIRFNVSTNGGLVVSGLGMYDYIKSITDAKRYKTICKLSGIVASMGTIVMLSCEERIAKKNTTFMIHSISGFSLGKIKDVEESYEEMKRETEMIRKIYTERTKMTGEMFDDIVNMKTDYYMNSEVALEYGLITSIE